MAYSDKVLDHYENPRNVGKMDVEKKNVGTGMVGAPACGDVMRLQIQVDDDGVIEDAKFKTYGCGSAIASSSLLTEWVKGKRLDEAERRLALVTAVTDGIQADALPALERKSLPAELTAGPETEPLASPLASRFSAAPG